MPPTEGHLAFGTKVLKGGIAGVPIAELTKIGGVPVKSDEVDFTSHDSEDRFEEVKQSIRRTGELTVEGTFIPGDTDGQVALYNDYLTGAVDDYAVLFPPEVGAAWTFKAFVKQPPVTDAPVEGKIPFTAVLRITGKPSLDISYSVGLTTPFFVISGSAVVTPAPAQSVFPYVASVATAISSVTITPTATAGVIEVNGNVVASGQPSSSIALGAAGSITNITIEVKETGKVARVYKIALARLAA